VSQFVASIGFGIVTAAILALAAVGFTLQFGVTNVLNLAYGGVMTSAAFVAYVVAQAGAGLVITLAAGAVSGAIASAALNRVVFSPFIRRGAGVFGMIVVAISVSVMIDNGLLAFIGPSFFSLPFSQGRSFHLGAMVFTSMELVIIGLSIVTMLALHALLRYTRIGKAMRATAADAVLARGCGVATGRVIDLAWLISGGLCGLAGVTLVLNLATFDTTTGTAFLVPIIAAAVLGGVGEPYGAMLGALIVGVASQVATVFIQPEYNTAVAFVILIIVLLVRPTGIMSEIAASRELTA
jgi:branched-chain amino acid transport system permease protein/neutral amino acid transport system permease protein